MSGRKTDVYMLTSLPKEEKRFHSVRPTFGQIERRTMYENGGLTKMRNIDLSSYPYIKSSRMPRSVSHTCAGTVCGFSVFDGCLYLVFRRKADSVLCLDRYDPAAKTSRITEICRVSDDGPLRRIIRFNRYDHPDNPVDGSYKRRVLVLPEFRHADITGGDGLGFVPPADDAHPAADTGVIFSSRLFCSAKGKVFASDFNDVTAYHFDTGDESLASNAWVSDTQSDVRLDGEITAVAVYDGHPVIFKRDYMLQVYNTKNPFRLVEIGPYGALSQEAVCTVGDKLAFVSEQGVMLFGGGYPKRISDALALTDYSGAMLASDGKNLFLYTTLDNSVWVYDVQNGRWGQRIIRNIRFLAGDENGVYYIDNTGLIAKIDDTSAGSYSFETDLSALGMSGDKRLCGFDIEMILGARSDVTLNLRDADGNDLVAYSAMGGGAKHHVKRFRGVPAEYVQLIVNGHGDATFGGITLLYESRGDAL